MVITYIEGMITINLLPTWEKMVDGYTVTRYDYVPPDEGVHGGLHLQNETKFS